MLEKLNEIKAQAEQELQKAKTVLDLGALKVKYLGKKGALTAVLRGMGSLSPEERPQVGQVANEVREVIEKILEERKDQLKEGEINESLKKETIDITLPGQNILAGHKHPITMVIDQMKDIFLGMGYSIGEGPEIELDYYNFEALNLPPDHPARDMQDSFYISDEVLLRTHTSPVQVRIMEKTVPHIPLKIICPGKVYRRDDDATHSPMFHQVEGLVIDKDLSMAGLKATLLTFARQMFGEDREIRLRPSYFPFTEPSAEVDISCIMCGGSGCRVCSHTGWIEILGAGMVHPRVLEMSGYDPEEVNGFAFGIGMERVAMLKYGIDDLRLLFENDLRFLTQF